MQVTSLMEDVIQKVYFNNFLKINIKSSRSQLDDKNNRGLGKYFQ